MKAMISVVIFVSAKAQAALKRLCSLLGRSTDIRCREPTASELGDLSFPLPLSMNADCSEVRMAGLGAALNFGFGAIVDPCFYFAYEGVDLTRGRTVSRVLVDRLSDS